MRGSKLVAVVCGVMLGWGGTAAAGEVQFQEGFVDRFSFGPESIVYSSSESQGAEVNTVEVTADSQDTASIAELDGVQVLPAQDPFLLADTLTHCQFSFASATCTASAPEHLESVVVALGALDDRGRISDSSSLLNVPPSLHGGSGNDVLRSASGSDYLNGGPGDDNLDGHGGNDDLSGHDGVDVLRGGPGNDTLRAAFDGGMADSVRCGPGADTAIVDSSDSVAADCETIQSL